jgi:hypothetical protein
VRAQAGLIPAFYYIPVDNGLLVKHEPKIAFLNTEFQSFEGDVLETFVTQPGVILNTKAVIVVGSAVYVVVDFVWKDMLFQHLMYAPMHAGRQRPVD